MAPAHGPTARPLTHRLLLWHAVAVLGVLLGLGIVVDRVLESHFVGQLTDSLISQARVVRLTLPAEPGLQSNVQALGRSIGARTTVVRTDGVVLADSEHDPTTMENHRTRPEIEQARQGRVGTATRRSATLGVAY